MYSLLMKGGGQYMPKFDRTGPEGKGPMTGRGMGKCGQGMGRRMGHCCGGHHGRGLGRYYGWNEPQTDEEKRSDPENYKKALQEEMEDTEKELQALNK